MIVKIDEFNDEVEEKKGENSKTKRKQLTLDNFGKISPSNFQPAEMKSEEVDLFNNTACRLC